MRELKNSELREVEEEMRSEETTMRDDSLHARYIIEICNQADTHFSAFKESGIYELTQTPDNNLETDIDIIIQEEFEKKVLEDPEECLQDLVSDKMYSTLQDIRNIARGFQESLIEENTEKTITIGGKFYGERKQLCFTGELFFNEEELKESGEEEKTYNSLESVEMDCKNIFRDHKYLEEIFVYDGDKLLDRNFRANFI